LPRATILKIPRLWYTVEQQATQATPQTIPKEQIQRTKNKFSIKRTPLFEDSSIPSQSYRRSIFFLPIKCCPLV
jgi:hypothetical protein